jgi:crotonobetaine/carnitine-CoA ligase
MMATGQKIAQDTITGAFARAVAAAPDRCFLDFSGERYSFGEVDHLTNRIANSLSGLGIDEGEPVATMLDNGLSAVACWLAINKLGAVNVPVNTGFRGDFLQAQLADCGARFAIVEENYADRLSHVVSSLPALQRVFVRSMARSDDNKLPWMGDYADLLSGNDAVVSRDLRPDQLAMIVYTSGTTGASKGCLIAHNHPCNMAWKSVTEKCIGADDVIWTPLPLYHMHAIAVTVTTAIIAQCTAAIAPRFSVAQFWPELERSGATLVGILGSMAVLIADAPGAPSDDCARRIRYVNAAPFPTAAVEKWRSRFGIQVTGAGAYGMSEAGTISTTRSSDPPAPPGASGRTGDDFDVRIFDDCDVELPVGAVGEIVCRPNKPNIMFMGYWLKPDATVAAWRNLWFHTGDLGRIDEEGFLFFVDRKKDYIRRRGENISTLELEAVFRQHPAIRDVAVHSVLSPLGEDEVKVTAELHDGTVLDEAELCRWSVERLPYFAVPQYVEFRRSLPRSATGKTLKAVLRDEGKTLKTWDREAAGFTFDRR